MHGTGHGIGAYLNVHEGPMGISWREIPNDPGLQAGMFLSNGNILSKYYLCPAKCLIHELCQHYILFINYNYKIN